MCYLSMHTSKKKKKTTTNRKVQWSEDVIQADPFFGRSRYRNLRDISSHNHATRLGLHMVLCPNGLPSASS